MKMNCLKCGEKKGIFSNNYSGLNVNSAIEHPFPERIEKLILVGDPNNEYFCEKCADEYKIKCKEHGSIENGIFKNGKPPICGKCYQEKQEENEPKSEKVSKLKGTIDKFLPKIKQLVTDKVGAPARGAADNKETMQFVVSKIYKFLPLPIRLTVSEEKLFNFCWEHRRKLFPETRDDSRLQNNENNQLQLSEAEKNYLKSVKFMLEDDNAIDGGERKMLERKRLNLGISEERANYIENIVLNELYEFSPEESEYFSEVKIYLYGDAQISGDERQVLERLSKKLNISKERSIEIENLAFSDQNS